jgi:hypothetical protein
MEAATVRQWPAYVLPDVGIVAGQGLQQVQLPPALGDGERPKSLMAQPSACHRPSPMMDTYQVLRV